MDQLKLIFKRNLWNENQVLRQILGICSILAVTNLMINTLVMGLGLIFVISFSSLTISLLRSFIPHRVRMITQVFIIAAFVILVDITIQAQLPEVSRALGPYVGLIITNCIIMGRAEAFAMQNGPVLSALDGFGNALGYSVILLGVAFFRELFGMGTLFNVTVLHTVADGGWYPTNGLMVLAPAAFFIIGFFIWAIREWKPEQVEAE